MPALDPSKVCFVCNEKKPITEFYRHPATRDGHLGKCKECTKAAVRANRAARIDHYREYDRRRFQENPERRAAHLALMRSIPSSVTQPRKDAYRARNREKASATTSVNNAVRNGKLEKRSTCEICGSTDRIHAHHHDYSKPLDVWWLCDHCHKRLHRMMRSAERKRLST